MAEPRRANFSNADDCIPPQRVALRFACPTGTNS
jgi:hypothetical protein